MRIEHTAHEELKFKYDRLLSFVKDINGCAYSQGCKEQYDDAKELLKEIGEL